MKNTFGNHITLTLFGESHGKAVGAVLDGLPAGVKLDEALMEQMMKKRSARGDISSSRHEKDIPQIISGIKNGYTCGTPVAFLIANENVHSADYADIQMKPRPSHADYAAYMKYGDYGDYEGAGHFSGRLTAPLCAAGALCMALLQEKGIHIGTHIASLHGIEDRPFDESCLDADIELLNTKLFPVLDDNAQTAMQAAIREARDNQDSLGGILDTAVIGLKAGIGEPWFDSVESMIAHAMFSIPALKGIEFGSGFDFAKMKGSEANDPFAYENTKVITLSNHNGGLNGGLSNGMPLRFRTVIKPTPSIAKRQKTVDLKEQVNTEIEIHGRHDPAIIHRAAAVVDALTAFVLCDFLIGRYGETVMTEDHA
jgi:chorismate synthase